MRLSKRGRTALTVDSAKHAAHLLQVAVIKEPDARVVLILLERNCDTEEAGQAGEQGRGGGRSGGR